MATRLNNIATLIVDDSEMECHLLRAQLGQFAWVRVLDCVHDGLEAIAYLHRTYPFRDRPKGLSPQLILLDFKMPRCDGMEVLKVLSHDLDRPNVVLWSSVLEQIDVPLAMELGADIVCSKPRCLTELADILGRAGPTILKPRSVRPLGKTRVTEPMHA